MWGGVRLAARLECAHAPTWRASLDTSTMRSSRSVQHMHPFCICTSLSSPRCSAASPDRTSSASTLTSDMSFTITATRRPYPHPGGAYRGGR